MVIDFHTHAFPDEIADRAVAKLQQASGDWQAVLDGRVSSLLASMDAAGIDRSVVCPIATKPEQFDGILQWCLAIRSDRIEPFGSVHPDDPNLADHVAAIAAAGLKGIKLHPMYQQFDADEPRLDPLYAAAAKHNLIVTLHCGCDIAFPESRAAHPHRIAEINRKHPTLKLVATHLGGWKAWDEVRNHLIGRDIWMETSFSLQFLPPGQAIDLIRAHGCHRVMFGTDSPWSDQSEDRRRLEALPLTNDEKAAMLGQNAQDLLA